MNHRHEERAGGTSAERNDSTRSLRPTPCDAQPPAAPEDKPSQETVLCEGPLCDPANEETRRNLVLTGALRDFTLQGVLGRGGFGTVYKALDTSLDRVVAIKVLNETFDEERIAIFQREAQMLASLSKHAGIVQIHRWGEQEGIPYFVLEFVEDNAADLLRRHPQGIPLPRALTLAAQAAEALAYMHRNGVLHRDIKPANILLELANDQVKLSDFGLAQFRDAGRAEDKRAVSGSPAYMSPEQAGGKALDERSDIFSLGVTLFHLISGRLPFEGNSPTEVMQRIVAGERKIIRDLMPKLPEPVVTLIERAIAHEKTERFHSAAEFAQQLRQVAAAIDERGAHPRSASSRMRLPRVVTTLAAGVLVAAGTWFLIPLLIPTAEAGTLSSARAQMDRENYAKARDLYSEYLRQRPGDDGALFGLGYAHLQEAALEEARKAFESIDGAEALRGEGLAATKLAAREPDAQTALQQALELSKNAYIKALLARDDLQAKRYDEVVKKLDGLSSRDFFYEWQYVEAMILLGQAYYRLNKLAEAAAVFKGIEGMASPSSQKLAELYANMIARAEKAQQDEKNVELAREIGRKIDAGEILEAGDDWTSRRLTLLVLPFDAGAAKSLTTQSLLDLLPDLLNIELMKHPSLPTVDRSTLGTLLTEQVLSANLSKDQRYSSKLGKFAGARLLVTGEFLDFGRSRSLRVKVTDVETSWIQVDTRVEVQEDDPIALAENVSKIIAAEVPRKYPLQGRLYADRGVPKIDIGAYVGVKENLSFDVFMQENEPALGNLVTTTGNIGSGVTEVRIEDIPADQLPGSPETGWYVRERPPS
ncbi:MAG: protein kinase [Candidatus Hydrogenedentes bacterium]|nr:protein kinase [Candidatus Hydrogenedentota bacterium]